MAITLSECIYDEYLLVWKGYPKGDATWVPSFDVSKVQQYLIDYIYIFFDVPNPSDKEIAHAVGNFT